MSRGWTRLSLVVPSNKTGGKGQKLMYRKFHPNMRRNIFAVQVNTNWNRFPRRAVGSPLLEIFRNRLDTILCYVLWDDPALVGTCCVHFQPYPFCDSVGQAVLLQCLMGQYRLLMHWLQMC